MRTNDSNGSTPAGDTRLDLDGYLLLDPQTQRVRFTQTGKAALAKRFARAGIDLRQLLTLEDVETAIARVTHREYERLSPQQQGDDATVDAIHDLDFITDGVTGQPLLPLQQRRARRRRAFAKLFAAIGIEV